MADSPRKIAVLGATGGTGRSFVEQAIASGYAVRALARDPSTASLSPAVEIVRGSVSEIEALRETVHGAGAVVSCLGAALPRSYGPRGRVGALGMRNLIPVMRSESVARLIAVSAFGAAESYGRTSLPFRLLMATVLRGIYADKNSMEPIIRSSDVEWTIVRPANLTNSPRSGRIAVNPPGTLGLRSRIARADVAAFLLCVAGGKEFVRDCPIIANC